MKLDEARELASLVENWWASIIPESHGVAGYHLNDAVAGWDEFPEIAEMRDKAAAIRAASEASTFRLGIDSDVEPSLAGGFTPDPPYQDPHCWHRPDAKEHSNDDT
jgi:hypothetical protein